MALLPHSYFRYLTLGSETAWKKLEETICRSSLPTSPLTNFNDPFEAGPVIFGDSSHIAVNGIYEGNTVYSSLAGPLWRELKGTTFRPDELVSAYTSRLAAVSFSRRINSSLLWSHYSNGYRGIVLHFTPSNLRGSLFEPTNQSHFQWVNYEKQRPLIALERIRHYFDRTLPHSFGDFASSALDAIELQFLHALLFWKADDWSYEQEARVVASSKLSSISFPPEELVGVIIGPRCTEDDIRQVQALVEQRQSPLAIRRARLSRTDYSVELEL